MGDSGMGYAVLLGMSNANTNINKGETMKNTKHKARTTQVFKKSQAHHSVRGFSNNQSRGMFFHTYPLAFSSSSPEKDQLDILADVRKAHLDFWTLVASEMQSPETQWMVLAS